MTIDCSRVREQFFFLSDIPKIFFIRSEVKKIMSFKTKINEK